MIRWSARRSKLRVLAAILSLGVLPYHQSCSVTARNGITNGVTGFLSNLTLDTLNAILRPGVTGSGTNTTGGQSGTDPFAPPAQI